MASRIDTLEALVKFTSPVSVTVSELRAFGWDSGSLLVSLTSEDMVSILNRFLSGELSACDVEEWANSLECRDDVEYSPSSAIGEVLYVLANPSISQALNRESAEMLVAQIQGAAT